MEAVACRGTCGHQLVSDYKWRQLPPPERDKLRAQGYRRHDCRGLCASCYARFRRTGNLTDHARRTKPTADTIEDWHELRAQGLSRAEAADRMGVTKKSLERAIERAKCRNVDEHRPDTHRDSSCVECARATYGAMDADEAKARRIASRRAQTAARNALARRYQDEYRRLYEDHKARVLDELQGAA